MLKIAQRNDRIKFNYSNTIHRWMNNKIDQNLYEETMLNLQKDFKKYKANIYILNKV